MKNQEGKLFLWITLGILTLFASLITAGTTHSYAQAPNSLPLNVTPTSSAYPAPKVGHSPSSNIDQQGSLNPAYPPPEDSTSSEVQNPSIALKGYPPPGNPVSLNPASLTYKIRLPIVLAPKKYDRQLAIEYADQWAHDRNIEFPNYGSTGACNDCTNYLSQMLYAGGHQLVAVYSNTSFDWWYYCDEFSVCTNSNTWSATDWMNQYATNYNNQKFGAPTGWVETLLPGDFFLMDLPTSPQHGIPNHSRLVVGWGYPEEGDNLNTWRLLINQHCTDRKRVRWDYNLPDGTGFWLWHVID